MFVVKVPEVTFKTRISIDEAPGFAWKDLTTRDVFAGKRVVLFSLPGAFTPTCSSTHLPGYEDAYEDILRLLRYDRYKKGIQNQPRNQSFLSQYTFGFVLFT